MNIILRWHVLTHCVHVSIASWDTGFTMGIQSDQGEKLTSPPQCKAAVG